MAGCVEQQRLAAVTDGLHPPGEQGVQEAKPIRPGHPHDVAGGDREHGAPGREPTLLTERIAELAWLEGHRPVDSAPATGSSAPRRTSTAEAIEARGCPSAATSHAHMS